MAEVLITVVAGDEVDEHLLDQPKALEEAVDADLNAFDTYFQRELKNAPLLPSERAILKTYLYYKTKVR